MPIVSIVQQPGSGSIKAAYRPIVFVVKASRTDGAAVPPVVYCDIYFNGIYYRTITKTLYQKLNAGDSEWLFDIQDACQEVIPKVIGENNGGAIVKVDELLKIVFCKFRSSGFDVNGFITSEGVAPIQGTATLAPVSGEGNISNLFYIINAVLQHKNNQDAAIHLGSFKTGTWQAAALPLTHRINGYKTAVGHSDYFPIVYTGGKVISCLKMIYKPKNSASLITVTSCGGTGGGTPVCAAVSLESTPSFPNGQAGQVYHYSITLNGDAPFVFANIVKPDWLTISLAGNVINFDGTPSQVENNVQVSLTVTNCSNNYSAPISGSFNVASNVPSCVGVSIADPVIPNGRVNKLYEATLNLSGTAPFVLSDISKPDWMSITLSGSTITLSGTPLTSSFTLPIHIQINNCSNDLFVFHYSIAIYSAPSITLTSNVVNGAIRTQKFVVGSSVTAGDRFYLMVYSHEVAVTADSSDTQNTIATKLKDALNATTLTEWNDHGSNFTNYKPSATSNNSEITITVNAINQFAAGVS